LVIWCEAAGMIPQLQRIADPYGIAVYCSGGFDGVTSKRQIGLEFAKLNESITVLHIGDHDPSGIHLFEALAEDIIAFASDADPDPDIEFIRLAITPEQAREHEVPDNGEPKDTDNRRFNFFAVRCATGQDIEYLDCDPTITWQAEGLDPATLADIVRDAIEDRIDQAAYQAVLDEEEELRKSISDKLEGL
jgi:hypothetical protein